MTEETVGILKREMAQVKELLAQELDHNIMKRMVVEAFNDRMKALEAQTTQVLTIQSASLEMIREIAASNTKQSALPMASSEKKRLIEDFAKSLE